MQTEAAERRRQPGRSRSRESGHGRAEPRGTQRRAVRNSEEQITRLKEIIVTMQQKEKQAGREETREAEEEEPEMGRGRDGGKRREKEVRSRRAASEGGEQSGKLRLRVHDLEKEKLELTSSHNQELCMLQAELTRLRSSVERGEAQREELQYQLTVSQRDADRVCELSRDKHTLTERAAELQLTVQELQKALDITRQAREEDQHALQQEVEERDRLIHSFSSENQRLHQLLQDHEEALEESERRMAEVQKEREKEAEVNRRQAGELKYLTEREERSRREKEVSDQRVKSLESSVEAERAAHLESKFNSEIIQLRGRDLEAALASERSGLQEAQCSLDLLRAQFREVERAYSVERERSGSTERALHSVQKEYEQCKSDLSVALEKERTTTSDLTERLEEEKRRHADTHTLLQQAAQRRSDSEQQVQDLLCASERLQEENRTLNQLTSDRTRGLEEAQQEKVRLEQEVTRLLKESSDWSTRSRGLQAELEREREEEEKKREEREKEKEEREKEREREKEEKEKEREREKEEREREREEWEEEREREREEREREREEWEEEREREREEKKAEVQKITELYQKESEARLSFLYCVYQRLLAGCVLLHQPQSILGNFTWEELCDVITEQVQRLTSDLRQANDQVAHLHGVCEKKSVCVRELQRSQECVLSRLEESVRRREEAWSSQHTHTVTQLQNELQVCRSQCASLRARASSLTSDLSRSRRDSARLLSACALLGGALRHADLRLQALCSQKTVVCRRLAEREQLEEEVRRLAAALGGEEEEEEEEEERRRRRALRRWRRSVCVVVAVRRWCELSRHTAVLLRVERGGVCVCAESSGQTSGEEDEDDEGGGVCVRWLRSKRLSSIILSSTADLQGALTHTGSAPPDVMSAARSSLSRLLDHLLDQSDPTPHLSPCRVEKDPTPPQPDMKALVATLQQHFLLFSQRLHSAEVERRGLRLEVTNLKRGLRHEREESCRTVPAQRFHSVCEELRQALSREQEAQTLIHTLQLRVNTHTAEQSDTQHTLTHTAQCLSEAQQEVSRKERSLRILGKHLSGCQRERKQLEERLQQVEDELREAARRKDRLISSMKAAETSCQQVRESLVQSRRSLSAQPRPLPLLREHLELNGAESIMGAPEVAACQSLLSTISQLVHTCSSRIDWLEQEVSAYRSHVTALRGELQDACLRDNQAYVPVAEFPEAFLLPGVETLHPVPLSDLSKELSVTLNPAPLSPHSKPLKGPKTKEKKAVKKNRAGRR